MFKIMNMKIEYLYNFYNFYLDLTNSDVYAYMDSHSIKFITLNSSHLSRNQ